MFISTTQINVTAIKVDCNCNAVPVQDNQGPATANDFTSVLKAILSDLNKTGLLTDQNGLPLDINELANGLLSDKDINDGQDKSLTDMLQQLMAQLQMTGQMPGIIQPVIVNVTQNNHPFSFMAGNSDVTMGDSGNAPVLMPVLMADSGNTGSIKIKLNSEVSDSVPEIKNEAASLLQSASGQKDSVLPADGFKSDLDILKDAQNNNGMKNTGDLSLQPRNAQNSGDRNTAEFKNVVSNLSDNITAANADKVKLEGVAPDFNNDLSAQAKIIAANEEGNSLNDIKVSGAETDSGTKELNGPVTATAQTHQTEYGKKSTAESKETVHISRLSELSEPIAKNLASGNSRLTIKLTPPELGNIQIKLRMENGVLKADFMVDSHSVKDLFSTAIPQIKTSLEDSGIKSGDFYVNLKKEGNYSDGREHQGADNFNKQQQKQQRKSGSQFYDFFA